MKFPFDNIIVDENANPNTLYLIGMCYKTVPIGAGEPPRTQEVIDWDAIAMASAVIKNIGEDKK